MCASLTGELTAVARLKPITLLLRKFLKEFYWESQQVCKCQASKSISPTNIRLSVDSLREWNSKLLYISSAVERKPTCN